MFFNIYATCIASFIARKLNEYVMQIIYLLVVLQQSVCEAWGKRGGFDEKLHREGKGRGGTKQRRVVEFTRSDPSLFLSLNVLNVDYGLLGK